MALSDIANEDFEATVTQQAGAIPGNSKISKADFTVALSSSKVRVAGVNAMKGPVITGVVPAFSAPFGCLGPMVAPGTAVPPLSGAGITLSANATKVRAEAQGLFLKGCVGQCACVGTDIGPPPGNVPTPYVGSCKFEITDAGQTKNRGA